MACPEDADTAAAVLTAALAGPAKVSGDAGSVEQHKLSDLIEVEKWERAKCATTKASRGLRITRLVPPGSI